jgi:hypothetical protein
VLKAYPGQENHDIDATRNQAMSEVDRRGILLERRFPHRRADERHAAEPLDHPGHLLSLATFERGDA